MKEYRVILLGCALLFASCEKQHEQVKSEPDDKFAQALARERSGEPLRELQERQKAQKKEHEAALRKIDLDDKRAAAAEDLESRRIDGQRKVALTQAKLNAEREAAGVDATPLTEPTPPAKP